MTKGLMDGWHGDENECNGYCRSCGRCEAALERQADDGIDLYLSEDY